MSVFITQHSLIQTNELIKALHKFSNSCLNNVCSTFVFSTALESRDCYVIKSTIIYKSCMLNFKSVKIRLSLQLCVIIFDMFDTLKEHFSRFVKKIPPSKICTILTHFHHEDTIFDWVFENQPYCT